jgi:itaconate CoA-transferase
VERPGVGDFARAYDQRVKRAGLALRLGEPLQGKPHAGPEAPAALAVLQELVADADVLVQNLAPGAAARMGLGADALQARTRGSSSATSRATAATARTATRRPTTC